MKIGLFFGSFNPVHHGHLIIAQHLLSETDLEQIWMVVSPQNPFKSSQQLLNEYQRLHLVRLATEKTPDIRAVDIEFRLPKPSYTIDTLTYLHEKYPQHEFCVIMGSDSLQNLSKWKNADIIMNDYTIYVYRRPGFDISDLSIKKLIQVEAPLLLISSSYIRDLIQRGKPFRFLMPEEVRLEIERGGYYRSKPPSEE
jgi:nicotinate-nucleotide adenylyltransferase